MSRRAGAARGPVLVRVQTADGAFAVPVTGARAVVEAEGVAALPSPAPGVLGTLDHGGAAIPVLAAFGAEGAHVLVVEEGGLRFGLLVERVTGVLRLTDAEVDPPPAGQAERLVAGIVRRTGAEALVLDLAVLRARLPA